MCRLADSCGDINAVLREENLIDADSGFAVVNLEDILAQLQVHAGAPAHPVPFIIGAVFAQSDRRAAID